MKNEGRIVELLSEILVKQDTFVQELREMKQIQLRQENHLINLLELMSDDRIIN